MQKGHYLFSIKTSEQGPHLIKKLTTHDGKFDLRIENGRRVPMCFALRAGDAYFDPASSTETIVSSLQRPAEGESL